MLLFFVKTPFIATLLLGIFFVSAKQNSDVNHWNHIFLGSCINITANIFFKCRLIKPLRRSPNLEKNKSNYKVNGCQKINCLFDSEVTKSDWSEIVPSSYRIDQPLLLPNTCQLFAELFTTKKLSVTNFLQTFEHYKRISCL